MIVTHAWHMRRGLWCFERLGMHALPWPAPHTGLHASAFHDFLPRSFAVQASFYALHELIGEVYYRLRH